MSNMSYCRFQNTLSDLRDCAENLQDNLSPEETDARLRLVKLCIEIVDSVGIEVNTHAEPTFYEDEEEADG
jgi:hypothetical protein